MVFNFAFSPSLFLFFSFFLLLPKNLYNSSTSTAPLPATLALDALATSYSIKRNTLFHLEHSISSHYTLGFLSQPCFKELSHFQRSSKTSRSVQAQSRMYLTNDRNDSPSYAHSLHFRIPRKPSTVHNPHG